MAGTKVIGTKEAMQAIRNCRVLRWDEHPLFPGAPLRPGRPLREWDGSNVYTIDDQSIGVDIAEIEAKVYRCGEDDLDLDLSFSEGASVLNFTADPLVNLVHLRFNPPVKAVGTHITGPKRDGGKYKVSCIVILDDGSKDTPFSEAPQGKFSSDRNTAPFVGIQVVGSKRIVELYCDILPTGTRDVDSEADVAISDLYFVPDEPV
ncbi:MAG: hypothetical protein CAF41_012730 [Nitrospira sp. CG24A]|nr:MAG: hypothetical protein CAF41_012730 [Nitrospira sp. CG24A]